MNYYILSELQMHYEFALMLCKQSQQRFSYPLNSIPMTILKITPTGTNICSWEPGDNMNGYSLAILYITINQVFLNGNKLYMRLLKRTRSL